MRVAVFLLAIALAACSTIQKIPPCSPSQYQAAPSYVYAQPSLNEADKGKYSVVSKRFRLTDDVLYHTLVTNPEIVGATQPPGMLLIALEKLSNMNRNAEPYCLKTPCQGTGQLEVALESLRESNPNLRKLNLDNPRKFVVTHIARIQQQDAVGSMCFVFNMYHDGAHCPDAAAKWDGADVASLVRSSVAAVGSTGKVFEDMVAQSRPTHILVFATGWNTSQGESLFNYGEWFRAAKRAATEQAPGQRFEPLIVGFSWQSTWDNAPGGTGISVGNKGNDADEIGSTWVNAVVQQNVMPVAQRHRLPVVLVGHSFGTRVLGHAVFLPELVTQSPRAPDAFIAFQAALPIRRFVISGKEGFWISSPATRTVLTASKFDSANNNYAVHWQAYAGGKYGLEMLSDSEIGSRIAASSGDDSGRIDPVPARGQIVLADLSKSVNCPKPGTGGAAHSDVFDLEAGKLIWQVSQAVLEGVPDRVSGND
jgi:hypothetical protein